MARWYGNILKIELPVQFFKWQSMSAEQCLLHRGVLFELIFKNLQNRTCPPCVQTTFVFFFIVSLLCVLGAAVQSKAGKFTNRNAPSAIIMEVCILLKSSWYRTNLPLILRRAIKMLVFANKSVHSFICAFIHPFCIRPSVVSVFLACDQPFSLAVFCVFWYQLQPSFSTRGLNVCT